MSLEEADRQFKEANVFGSRNLLRQASQGFERLEKLPVVRDIFKGFKALAPELEVAEDLIKVSESVVEKYENLHDGWANRNQDLSNNPPAFQSNIGMTNEAHFHNGASVDYTGSNQTRIQ